MKKPMSKTTKPTPARAQGTPPGKSGVGKPVKATVAPGKAMKPPYRELSQTQKS